MKYVVTVEEVEDGQWRVAREFSIHSRGWTLVVPAGDSTDLASVPRIGWCFIAPYEDGLAGPSAHDHLYRNGGRIRSSQYGYPVDGVVHTFTRGESDAFLNDIMKQDGVARWRRWATYLAVRCFGRSSWHATQAVQAAQATQATS